MTKDFRWIAIKYEINSIDEQSALMLGFGLTIELPI